EPYPGLRRIKTNEDKEKVESLLKRLKQFEYNSENQTIEQFGFNYDIYKLDIQGERTRYVAFSPQPKDLVDLSTNLSLLYNNADFKYQATIKSHPTFGRNQVLPFKIDITKVPEPDDQGNIVLKETLPEGIQEVTLKDQLIQEIIFSEKRTIEDGISI